MMIHDITAMAGKYKAKKRVGRGLGSGTGKTSSRGHKGQKARSGYAAKRAHEGGQMPYFRRMRKVGFSNFNFTTRFWIVNLRDIVAHPHFASGGAVNRETLIKAGLIRDLSRDLKILGDMGAEVSPDGVKGAEPPLTVKLQVTAHRVSDKARKVVIGAGGTVQELGTRRDVVRGVDRNAEDRKPKNLTKKLKRGSDSKGKAAMAAAAAAKAESEAPAPDAKPAKASKPKSEGKSEGKPEAKKEPKAGKPAAE